MKCPQCQSENPEHAKFCLNCGTPLVLVCPHCGTSLPAGAKFCFNCGQAVAAQSPAQRALDPALARIQKYLPKELLAKLEAARTNRTMEGERRVVTVLFCDVKGSTALAETLDPEEWTEIMNTVFQYLIEPVFRYEGTLARMMGDAILAFFGAPIAHEDDPQRAVLAGLGIVEGVNTYREQIKRERGLDLNVRVGINTGLVVVGEVGSDLHVEYTAMGDAVNLAARMEQTAEPGTIQIAFDTYKSIAPLFEVEPLGDIEIKGKSEPVKAFRVLRVRNGALPVRGISGLHSPMVGRERELQTLLARVEELRQGRGQIVSVMGEAGLGKSRLMAELRQELAERELVPGGLNWYEGRSLSFETALPYAPFIRLFSAYFGLQPDESDTEKYRKVQTQVAEVLPARVMEVAPFIATVLGIPFGGEDHDRVRFLMPPDLRARIFQATQVFVEELARQKPLVLVFEDVHWIDPTSRDLLKHLLPLARQVPLLVQMIFRPQRQEPSWHLHELALREYGPWYSPIELHPLDEHTARTLVGNLLYIEDLPEKVRALILAKAEGNPFYVEEMIRSLLDAGLVVFEGDRWRATREIAGITVPTTLAGVITARLDRLDEESRRVAQTAAVIGREFQYDVLGDVSQTGAVLDEAIGTLQQRELIREYRYAPRRVYLFKHVLTQETAYASLLLSRRRELHRQVAECMERMEPDHVIEIARHFSEAKESGRALPYVVEAGDRAARAYATQEAIGWYTQALQILQTVDHPALAQRTYEGLGEALMLSNDLQGAIENYRTMLQYAEDRNVIPMKVSALNKLAGSVMWLGLFDQVEQHLSASEQIALQYGDIVGLAELYTIRCNTCNISGQFERGAQYMDTCAQLGRKSKKIEQMAYGMTHTAFILTNMTRYDEAWQKAQDALPVIEESGMRQHMAELLSLVIPMYHLRNGDLDAAYQAAEQGLNESVRIGQAWTECMAAYVIGLISRMRGDFECALDFFERSLQAARMSFYPGLPALALSALAMTRMTIGEGSSRQIDEYLAQAHEMLSNPISAAFAGSAWVDLGFSALEQGHLEPAKQFFQNGLAMPSLQWLILRPYYQLGLAQIALTELELDEAAQLVSEAREYVEARAMKYIYPLVDIAHAQVCIARGELEQALELLGRAEEAAVAMQMLPLYWQAQAAGAELCSKLERSGEAEAKRNEARRTIDQIAQRFQDEHLRSIYITHALQSGMLNQREA